MIASNRKLLFHSAVLIASSLAGSAARADPASEGAPSSADEARPAGDARARTVDRQWLYVGDARVAAPLDVVGLSSVTYTSVTSSPTRPFAANVGTPGGMMEAGGEVGLLPHLSMEAEGVTGLGGATAAPTAGAMVAARVSLLPAAWQSTHLVASGGYLRELTADNGVFARLALTQDIGRARFAGTVHGEHVFAQGRDGVDVMVMAGASYRVAGPFRAGAEYVGQDLEAALSDDAEGGVRHFVGPVASLLLLEDRLSIVVGPSLGLSYASPKLLGRLALAYAF